MFSSITSINSSSAIDLNPYSQSFVIIVRKQIGIISDANKQIQIVLSVIVINLSKKEI